MALEGGQGDHACPNNFSPTPKVWAIKPAIPCPELVQGPGPGSGAKFVALVLSSGLGAAQVIGLGPR